MADTAEKVRDPVWLALCLGWRLAELYNDKSLPGPRPQPEPRPLPAHLPGLGEMSAHERACALVARVGADLECLGSVLGIEMATSDSVHAVLQVAGVARNDVRKAVLTLYLEVRDQLAGSTVAAAEAFGLGRMLADTVLLPTTSEPQLLVERFGKYRIANALDWLDDLDARLPAHSAAAVRASLRAWEQWVSSQCRNGMIDPTKVDKFSIRALRRQGDLWRRLLAGEQAADQLLDGRAYVGAAASLLANGRRIALHYLWKWSWAILLVTGSGVAAVWAAVTYAPAGTDRVTAVLASAAGFLGVSWVGARATLGPALRQAEKAIWDAEVVAAIGKAATITPRQQDKGPELPHDTQRADADQPQLALSAQGSADHRADTTLPSGDTTATFGMSLETGQHD